MIGLFSDGYFFSLLSTREHEFRTTNHIWIFCEVWVRPNKVQPEESRTNTWPLKPTPQRAPNVYEANSFVYLVANLNAIFFMQKRR